MGSITIPNFHRLLEYFASSILRSVYSYDHLALCTHAHSPANVVAITVGRRRSGCCSKARNRLYRACVVWSFAFALGVKHPVPVLVPTVTVTPYCVHSHNHTVQAVSLMSSPGYPETRSFITHLLVDLTDNHQFQSRAVQDTECFNAFTKAWLVPVVNRLDSLMVTRTLRIVCKTPSI